MRNPRASTPFDPRIIASFGPFAPAPSQGATLASAVWPAANRVHYYPFCVPYLTPYDTIVVFNGATVNGNLEVGIYDKLFNLMRTSGSVAQAGTTSSQVVPLTSSIALARDNYYLGFTHSSGTATFQREAATAAMAIGVLMETPGAFGLPTAGAPDWTTDAYMAAWNLIQSGLVL